ncbi:MAG: hypothetical protein WD049_07940, partial [Candidatus Paceibacterota bacterium]
KDGSLKTFDFAVANPPFSSKAWTSGQSVRGVIIALENDQKLRRALSMVPTIDFFRYSISFKLSKADELSPQGKLL